MQTRIKVAENEVNLYPQDMETSLKSLEEALSIRRQISALENRLASLLGTASRSTSRSGPRGMSLQARAKLAPTMRELWAARKPTGLSKAAPKKGGLTQADRKRLSQLLQ